MESQKQKPTSLSLAVAFSFGLGVLVSLFAAFQTLRIILGWSKIMANGSMAFVAVFMFLLICWGYALLPILLGVQLVQRRRFRLCKVLAIILCLCLPFGTIVGITALVALSREAVKPLFSA
jgi:hypothetical protein